MKKSHIAALGVMFPYYKDNEVNVSQSHIHRPGKSESINLKY